MEWLIFSASLTLSLLTTLLIMPFLINKLKQNKITGKDNNKKDKPDIAEMGGIGIFFGFCAGMLLLIAWSYSGQNNVVTYIGIFSSVTLITIIGMIDDLLNIRQSIKAVTPVIAAFPLVAIRAGEKIMSFPLIGKITLGRWYYGIAGLGVTGAANAVNMLAGLNGLEALLGLVACSSIITAAIITNNTIVAYILACLSGSLIAFLMFNWHPARIFPGDTGTLMIGATIGATVIAGNMEKVGVIAFGLYFIELMLKARSKFKSQCFGKIQEDGTLKHEGKITSVTHAVMRMGKFTEEQVVLITGFLGLLFGVLAVLTVL